MRLISSRVIRENVEAVLTRGLFVGVSRRKPLDHPRGLPRCPRCGSKETTRQSSSGLYYCHRCFRLFRDVPEVPFDFVTDGWTQGLGELQATGEVLVVRLPEGFCGVCLLGGQSVLESIRSGGAAARNAADRGVTRRASDVAVAGSV